ncbi:MAG: hypothetical protein ACRDOG_13295 [Gaiellaceae bacterium]
MPLLRRHPPLLHVGEKALGCVRRLHRLALLLIAEDPGFAEAGVLLGGEV